MDGTIIKRVGWILLAIGIIDLAITIARLSAAGPYPAVFDGIGIIAGIFLLTGGPRAALWVRMLAAFLLAAGVAAIVATPFFQPLNLTLTEIRLDPLWFVSIAAPVLLGLAVLVWVVRELGRQPVQDVIVAARIRRWDMRVPAQAGGGVVLLACFLLWLALHGQSAQLAESLAIQQLGPGYRYHLSWIRGTSNGHGTSVSGVVTAWNDKEIKKILMHWETP